jgi:hypothetical protein
VDREEYYTSRKKVRMEHLIRRPVQPMPISSIPFQDINFRKPGGNYVYRLLWQSIILFFFFHKVCLSVSLSLEANSDLFLKRH